MILTLSKPGAICSAGADCDAIWAAATKGDAAGLVLADKTLNDGSPYWRGQVPDAQLPDRDRLPRVMRTRNNQLLHAALRQIEHPLQKVIAQVGAHRVGVVLGTSTSGIASGEAALAYHEQHGSLPDSFDYTMQEMYAPAECVAALAGVEGPAYSISTACSSSARAFMSARSLLASNVVDAVVVGGVDSLCQLTLNGFKALASMAPTPCNPFSRNRQGITIGEAAGLFIATRAADNLQDGTVCLTGACSTSDAHHMSAPHPQGRGAIAAMKGAMADAGISADELGYINLHGTATPLNDKMEAYALHQLGLQSVPASSTKGLTGHTLGAAGAIEAVMCWLALTNQNALPRHVWDGESDPELDEMTLYQGGEPAKPVQHCLSNSFAFGGNNVSLIISRRGL